MSRSRPKCPSCGRSEGYAEGIRFEHCDYCGYDVWYGDAHANGSAQITTVNGVPRGISQEEYDKLLRQERGDWDEILHNEDE